MKLKLDFVTNSSSSSFVAIGTTVDLYELLDPENEKVREVLINYGVNESEIDRDTVMEYKYDIIDKLLEFSGLSYAIPEWCDDAMIGLPYSNMDEDKTIRETKELVKALIKKTFDIDCEPAHIEECWMDN